MPVVQYKVADQSHIPGTARIRGLDPETEGYWHDRITGYLNGLLNPQKALAPRIMYVAMDAGTVVGFIAGHLTLRYDCSGELEWISVLPQYQRRGIASGLLRLLTAWFVEQKSLRVCVDVDPANGVARTFYKHHGAIDLNAHWLVWENIGSQTSVG